MPATPSPLGKRPRATWSLDEKVLKYTLRRPEEVSTTPPPIVERPQAPSPPAKRVRVTRPDGTPLLPEGWREEVRVPASGREYRVYLGPEAGQMADSRVKAWEAFERAKQGLPLDVVSISEEESHNNRVEGSGEPTGEVIIGADGEVQEDARSAAADSESAAAPSIISRMIGGVMSMMGVGLANGDGTGGSGKNLPPEFTSEKHVRGVVSMARAASPASADSQFFICFERKEHLDGQYTIWGQVIKGMDKVEKIKRGSPFSGSVTNPDIMKKVTVGNSKTETKAQ